jgi:hypothetical protein
MNSRITKVTNVNNEVTEAFEEFTCLGSPVTAGRELHDVTACTVKENGTFVELLPLWWNKNISMENTIRMFNCNVNSVLLCGCGNCKLIAQITNKLQPHVKPIFRQNNGHTMA